ncbi:tetratricopeptide repeat protein 5-like isoform X2 [Amborella trichopoda]|uniref:tetratricopeptide repeat protein 5-like isoform X2 n=1 Tax=Amborella trichopoda TaxID=13333 RepID=UPI0009BEEB36|nr:tetratricopeptide repeat protein 5-like isoform X2 [Amborella trichopoda]|eukprot:XP_020522848.1 tetratricopeptide repeat protein 5-like isoform X2 [Amborella trichopoda]
MRQTIAICDLRLGSFQSSSSYCKTSELERPADFPPMERRERLQREADEALKLLEKRVSSLERATYEYLRGKILDVFPEHCKEVEDHLSTAITLNSFIQDAWLCLDILGNSYFVSFSVGGSQDEEKLKYALKAYANDEKDESLKINSDLHFNKAILNKLTEKYDAALRGFEAAALQNPSLNTDKIIEKIIKILDKLNDSVTNKGHLKPRWIASIVEALRKTTVNIPYKMATLNLLRDGRNNGMAVLGKVMVFIRFPFTSLPYFLLCDSDGTFFIIPLYALSSNGVMNGATVRLLDPNCRVIDFSWKGKKYDFKSIRVDRLGNILVNGSPPHSDHKQPMAFHAHA